MKIFRIARLMLLALIICVIPASSFAGVFISVGFAPPVLPVYEQPPCPDEGLMWTPGYWAYGPDGYYWVPGAWVPVPYEGALWTPPYWGWESGLYRFHPGYWGRHVGYYGGVNYGFGYMGVGFVGGMWRGHDFVYNTAVMHVDNRRIRNVYIDRTIVQHNTIYNDRRVAFSGGPGGIRHDPRPDERFAERDQHMDATQFQHSHESSAMSDRGSYYRSNGGRPSNPAMSRPNGNAMQNGGGGYQGRGDQGRGNYSQPQSRPGPQQYDRGPQQQSHGTPQQFDRGGAQPQQRQAPQQFDRGGQPRPQGGQPQRGGPQQHDQGQHNGDHRDHQH
jgi:hypothetical protein